MHARLTISVSVDRILRQQKAERQAAADAARAKVAENNALISRPSYEGLNEKIPSKPLPTVPPRALTESEYGGSPSSELDSNKNQPRQVSTLVNSLQNLKRKFGSTIEAGHSASSQNGIMGPSSSTNNSPVTPLSNICECDNHFCRLAFADELLCSL
jgi:hypothetical protein